MASCGAYWRAGRKKWCARIRILGKHIDLGIYTDPERAAKNYDHRLLAFWKESNLFEINAKPYLNFPRFNYDQFNPQYK